MGLVDTLGRSFATDLARLVLRPRRPTRWGRRWRPWRVYLLMAAVLAVRPAGLMPARTR